MRFTPQEDKPLDEGDYAFLVKDAKEDRSSKGSPMMKVRLEISNGKGGVATVYDNILDWNYAQFCASLGDSVTYGQTVDVEPYEFVGRKGLCHLVIDEYNGVQRNKVGRYLPTEAPKETVKLDENGDPDDLPY